MTIFGTIPGQLSLEKEIADLVFERGVVLKYHEGRLCSCVAENDGHFDPADDCSYGFRYKSPVEYRLMRTLVDFRQLTERAGKILQGGSTLTIPRRQKDHHALVTGTVDFSSGGVDLSVNKNIEVSVDGGTESLIDCSSQAADATDVKLYEVILAINGAGLGEIAYEGEEDGDPRGSGYLTIRSLSVGDASSVTVLMPPSADATKLILGLNVNLYPYRYEPSKTDYQFVPVYDSVSRGDVFVIANRTRRDGAILQRGILDSIKAFDVERILTVSKKGTNFEDGLDYTLSGTAIQWNTGKGPAANEHYSIEFLSKVNYIVYNELAADRGTDSDEVAKHVHLALRNYADFSVLPID